MGSEERRGKGGEMDEWREAHQWCNCMNRPELAFRFEIVLQQLVLGCAARSTTELQLYVGQKKQKGNFYSLSTETVVELCG